MLLIIKEPGHTISIPGKGVCRTPFEVEIDDLKASFFIVFLKGLGISNFELKSVERERHFLPKSSVVSARKKINEKSDFSLEQKINNIEKLLLDLKESKKGFEIKLFESDEEVEKIDDEKIEINEEISEYIPTPDLSGLEVGVLDEKSENRQFEMMSTAKKLREISGGV